MSSDPKPGFQHRGTDSDVRCSLLLAAVRAFQRLNDADEPEPADREQQLMVEFAEPVVVPDLLRR